MLGIYFLLLSLKFDKGNNLQEIVFIFIIAIRGYLGSLQYFDRREL